jgi:hypothetical protein
VNPQSVHDSVHARESHTHETVTERDERLAWIPAMLDGR